MWAEGTKGRKIDDLDTPDRFHAEFGVFDDIDLADAVLRQACGRTADRAEVKATMFLAGGSHSRRSVPLGEHHLTAAVRLEQIDVGVHASRRRRAERA